MTIWPGKVLLFGEYSLLVGGEALAVPFPHFSGHWGIDDGKTDPELLHWAEWLDEIHRLGQLPWPVDTTGFLQFVRRGGRFVSTIPPGAGLGSSGALVAATMARWGSELPNDPWKLKTGLAHLESFFHGQSSGLDPLVSLTGRPVQLDGAQRPVLLKEWAWPRGLFLLDSGIHRSTAHLVASFRAALKDPVYLLRLQQELLPAVSVAIRRMAGEDRGSFGDSFSLVSQLQRQLFGEMIPQSIRDVWQGDTWHLKLCGAGGGGHFLGWSPLGQIPELPFRTVSLDT